MKTLLHFFLTLITVTLIHLCVNVIPVHSQCIEDQKLSLLHLKESLIFDPSASSKLKSWNSSTDCCSWAGVTCANGHVVGLDLSDEFISGGIHNSSSLFDLQHLQSLNLAFNRVGYGFQIPSAIGKLTNLSYLNLSNTAYSVQIPIEISRLTRLVILDLSSFYIPGDPTQLQLEHPSLSLLIGNFSKLIELHLDGVDISAHGTDWCQVISSSLPNLRVLSLSSCGLSGPIDPSLLKLHSLSVIHLQNNNLSAQVPEFFSNFTNLTSLRLGNCGLYGTFPDKIFQVPTLEMIDLTGNPQLQGSLPDFPKNGSLRSLILSGANFSGQLPNSIGNLKMLSKIDIWTCNFTGSIPSSMENLTQLAYLDLSWNKFNGPVPFFSTAKNLTLINFSFNQLTGQINSFHWETLTNLLNLDLRHNLLDGRIPMSLLSHPLLQKLQLSNNQFSGQLFEFSNISLLDTLDLSSNNLEGPIPPSIFNLLGLKILSLSSNNFSGSFSLNHLQQLKNLSRLDLSYNSLSITYNRTSSSYSSFPNITTLKLASGKLATFPDFLRNQSRLVSLDLSINQIPGQIPNWIWKLGSLSQLNLSCNSFVTLEGPSLNLTSSLYVLDLHSNQLQGQIPVFRPYATYLDYSSNHFSSIIRPDIGDYLTYTVYLSLSSNNFHGIIPESLCNASYLKVLDLSNNSLSGMIPQCLTQLTAMSWGNTFAVLNLRTNNLSGTIPDKFPRDCSLKTLDLSGNQIEGKFPESLGNCRLLEVLNLGNNQISDTFPRLLNKMSSLRVLSLRSNKFFGRIGCPKTYSTWPMLQIIDLAHNNFSGQIPGRCLTTWQAMMADESDTLSQLKHIQFQVLRFDQLFYEDKISVTSKGQEMQLVKILTIFTSIDFSGNRFSGSIPKEMGELKSLYVLNLSNNALTGEIPSALGNLRHVESLDLSKNKLRGKIPSQFTKLTFLSFLNLSNNRLTGRIPTSTQLSTFPANSFAGNEGLWGPPLTGDNVSPLSPPPLEKGNPNNGPEIDFDLISAEIGCIFGFGIVIGPLVFCERWRKWYYRAVENIFFKIFPRLDKRSGNQGRVYRIRRRRH